MKNFIIIFFIYLFSLSCFNIVNAKTYRIGTTFENEIQFSKKIVLPLSNGKWEVVDRYTWSYAFLRFKGNWIARIENNEIMEMITIERANLAGAYMGEIDSIVNEIIFKDKYDGCYERPEYYKLGLYKKGSAHNCLVIEHFEVKKDIYFPEDPEATFAQLKKWLRGTNYTLPPIMLGSSHSYFSRLTGGNLYRIGYAIDPLLLGAPESEFKTEETSEYHKYNINKHLEHKKIMDEFVKLSFQRHQEFEKIIKARGFQRLKFEDLK